MTGRAFVFGDNIDTDLLAPGLYMKRPARELASHCLETLDPHFASTVQPGDFLVAGRNFGMGSSREQAAESLKLLGVEAVIAISFARIFYRNAINLGLLVLTLPEAGHIGAGSRLRVDAQAGTIDDMDAGRQYHTPPLPDHLLAVIRAGGLIPHLKSQFKASGANA